MACRMLSSAMRDRQGAGSKISFAICLGVRTASAKTHFCAGPCSLYCCSKEQCERNYFPERSVPKDEACPPWVTSFDIRTAPQICFFKKKAQTLGVGSWMDDVGCADKIGGPDGYDRDARRTMTFRLPLRTSDERPLDGR